MPLGRLLEFFAMEAGKSLGRKISRDMVVAEKAIVWTHADKIGELASDSELSPTYLRQLVDQSATKSDLSTLTQYLSDPWKTANLTAGQKREFIEAVAAKIQTIEDSEALRALIDAAKAKGFAVVDIVHHLL